MHLRPQQIFAHRPIPSQRFVNKEPANKEPANMEPAKES